MSWNDQQYNHSSKQPYFHLFIWATGIYTSCYNWLGESYASNIWLLHNIFFIFSCTFSSQKYRRQLYHAITNRRTRTLSKMSSSLPIRQAEKTYAKSGVRITKNLPNLGPKSVFRIEIGQKSPDNICENFEISDAGSSCIRRGPAETLKNEYYL